MINRYALIAISLMLCSLLLGCASFRTLDASKPGKPLIYSGTRLDWYHLNGGCCPMDRFGAEPPTYALLDLPFSFVVDTVALPATVCAELGLGLSVSGGI